VIAYKFLRSGRLAPFSGLVWPEPDKGWVEAEGELSLCSRGVHACRVGDLPYWIAEELWRVELRDEVVEHELKLVARRGRLVERIASWDRSTQERFSEHCLRRVAYHAAGELRAAGLEAEADLVERTGSSGRPEELGAAATSAASAAAQGGRPARYAGHVAEYVVDAAGWLDEPAGVAYVAARAADARTSLDGGGDPFVLERELQARWLQDELGLEAVEP
jgi:hypothetical protein